MSNDTYTVVAESRSDMGKGASRRLRREGKVPAVLYGGEKGAVSLQVIHKDLVHSLENEAFYSHILTLSVDGAEEQAVLKDLQRHPAKPMVLHADFMRVDTTHKIRMHVPIHFTGEDVAPGVKADGGVITHNLTDVEIICLPQNLPEFLVADLSNLEIEHALHLSDIQLPEGVEIVSLTHGEEHDLPIAAIHKTRGSSDEDEDEATEVEVSE
jgi:large subunit ribosomal protein L25